VLRDLLGDAVYLDEEAFAGAGTLQLYAQRVAAQQRRARELEGVAEALRAEVALKDEALAAARDTVTAANARVREMQGELDANATVFELRERRLVDCLGEGGLAACLLAWRSCASLHNPFGLGGP
jgi:hypothetical protein